MTWTMSCAKIGNRLFARLSFKILGTIKLLGDPAITTAILYRLLHKSEVNQLSGDSYLLKHRQTISWVA